MFLFCAAPFFLMDDVSVRSDLAESGAATAYQAAGLLLFFLCSIPVLRTRIPKKIVLSTSFFLAMSLAIYLAISSGVGLNPIRSVGYAALIFLFMFVMSFYGRNVEEIYQAARLCGPTIALTVLSVSIVHPFNGSTFGGIQPNSLAKACLVGFSFAFLEHKRRFRLPLQLFFIAVIVLLTSRASGIVLVATTIAVWFFGYARAIGRVHLPLIAVATIAFFVVLAFMFYATGNLAVELDANNQKDRNVQNRFDAWNLALEQIELSPLIGYGFRTRANYRLDGIYEPRASVNAHNGYLNFVLDSGFIGLALLTVFWATEIAKNVLQILRYQLDRTGTRLLSVYTAILVATTLMWLSEPITFNFGNFWSLAFAIALFGSLPIREAVRKRGKRYA